MYTLGLIIIFGIILAPIYIFIAASFIGKPRRPRTVLLYLGIPLMFFIGAIVGMKIMGIVVNILIS